MTSKKSTKKQTTPKASSKSNPAPEVVTEAAPVVLIEALEEALEAPVAAEEAPTPEEVVIEAAPEPVVEAPVVVEEKKAPKVKASKASTEGAVIEYFLNEGALDPILGYAGDAAFDLCTPEDILIPAKGSLLVDTGVQIHMPQVPDALKGLFNMAGVLWSKSGISAKMDVEKGAGLIDPNYTGTLKVKLFNHGSKSVPFAAGSRIVQMMFVPVLNIQSVVKTDKAPQNKERGAKGFGSQGV